MCGLAVLHPQHKQHLNETRLSCYIFFFAFHSHTNTEVMAAQTLLSWLMHTSFSSIHICKIKSTLVAEAAGSGQRDAVSYPRLCCPLVCTALHRAVSPASPLLPAEFPIQQLPFHLSHGIALADPKQNGAVSPIWQEALLFAFSKSLSYLLLPQLASAGLFFAEGYAVAFQLLFYSISCQQSGEGQPKRFFHALSHTETTYSSSSWE